MVNEIRSKKMKVGRLDVHYFTGGEGDPLVVIHGGSKGAKSWLQNLTELSQHYTIFAPDLPGFGDSQPISDGFHIAECVDFMDGFTRTLGLTSFHLVGHSLGGGIALHYALEFPHRIERLVLVSSMFLGKEIALWARLLSLPAFRRSLGEAGIGIFRAIGWLIRQFYAPFEFAIDQARVKMSIGKSVMSFRGQTTVLLNQLSELLIPTLIVWGAKDIILPVSQAYTASELIPDCQLRVFNSCGHSVHQQRVEEFSQLLTRFLG